MFNFFDNDAEDLFGLGEVGEQELGDENLSINRLLSPYYMKSSSDESIPEAAAYRQNVEFQNSRRNTIRQVFNLNRVGNDIPCSQIDNDRKDPMDYFAHLLKDYDFDRSTESNIHFASKPEVYAQNKENRRALSTAGSQIVHNRSKPTLPVRKLSSDPICLTETADGTFVCTPSKSETSLKSVFRTSFMENVGKSIRSTAVDVKPISIARGRKPLSLHNLPHPDVILKKKRFSRMFPAPTEPTKSNKCLGLGKDKFSQHLNEVKRRCSMIGDLSRNPSAPVASKRSSQPDFDFNLALRENFDATFSGVQPSLPFFLPPTSSVEEENHMLFDEKLNSGSNFHFEPKFFINPKLSASTSRTAVTEATLLNHFETPAFNNVLAIDADFEPFKSPPFKRNSANRDFAPLFAEQTKLGPAPQQNDFFWTVDHEP